MYDLMGSPAVPAVSEHLEDHILPGRPGLPVFIFLHGLGTPNDLAPLAQCFNEEGYTCDLLSLRGHDPESGELSNASYDEWKHQLTKACERHRQAGRKVYLVGFSLGGLLALDVAAGNSDVAGILSISTFLAPAHPRYTSFLLWRAELTGKSGLKRRLQVTDRSTRGELIFSPQLPLEMLRMLIEQGRRISQRTGRIKCPVLFIHSLHDHVASYEALMKTIRHHCMDSYYVATFHGLNHFLQFDISPGALVALAVEFFQLNDGETSPAPAERPILVETLKQCYEESRHWAGLLFQLVVGFFSVFGALIYFSLEEVLDHHRKAPYFVVSYTLAINLYLLLALLYFFYVARTLVYLKCHLEPQLLEFPWASYKTLPWAAGVVSEKMTRAVYLSMAALPGITSLALIIYAPIAYPQRFLSIRDENVLLQISLVMTAALWIRNAWFFISVRRYIKQTLYDTACPMATTSRFQSRLFQLYSKVSPGCVRKA